MFFDAEDRGHGIQFPALLVFENICSDRRVNNAKFTQQNNTKIAIEFMFKSRKYTASIDSSLSYNVLSESGRIANPSDGNYVAGLLRKLLDK